VKSFLLSLRGVLELKVPRDDFLCIDAVSDELSC
jgi:hypothetical protein